MDRRKNLNDPHKTANTGNQRSDFYQIDRNDEVRNSMDILIEITGHRADDHNNH